MIPSLTTDLVNSLMLLVCGAFVVYLLVQHFSLPSPYNRRHWQFRVDELDWQNGSLLNKFNHPIALAIREQLESEGLSVLWSSFQGSTIEIETRDARLTLRVPATLQTKLQKNGHRMRSFKSCRVTCRTMAVRMDRQPLALFNILGFGRAWA